MRVFAPRPQMNRGGSKNVLMQQVHSATLDPWPDTSERGRMESRRLCAYNQTRRFFLGLDIVAGDFSSISFTDWISRLTPQSHAGLWLVPFRGMPTERASVPIDLMYLDVNCRVIDLVEFFPSFSVSASTPPAASVLVLPSHTIHTSQTAIGDRLIVSSAEEINGRVGSFSKSGRTTFATSGARPVLVSERPPLPVVNGRVQLVNVPEAVRPAKSSQEQDTSLTGNGAEDHVSRRSRLARWLFSPSRARTNQQREPATGLFAFFWTGGAPQAHVIRDINASGLYVRTSERWYIGTVVRITLSLAGGKDPGAGPSICVHAEAIHWGNDGVELRFVLRDALKRVQDLPQSADGADGEQLKQFLEMWRRMRPLQGLIKGEGEPGAGAAKSSD